MGWRKVAGVCELRGCRALWDGGRICIGDDVGDLGVFGILPDFNGIGISVGRDVPGITARFDRPADLRRWLEQISRTDAFATPGPITGLILPSSPTGVLPRPSLPLRGCCAGAIPASAATRPSARSFPASK